MQYPICINLHKNVRALVWQEALPCITLFKFYLDSKASGNNTN